VLKGNPNVYFANAPLASGVLEGIHHYRQIRKNLQDT